MIRLFFSLSDGGLMYEAPPPAVGAGGRHREAQGGALIAAAAAVGGGAEVPEGGATAGPHGVRDQKEGYAEHSVDRPSA